MAECRAWLPRPDGPDTRPQSFGQGSLNPFFLSGQKLFGKRPAQRRSLNRFEGASFHQSQGFRVSQTITARSIRFCSSRMFPGHGYRVKAAIVSAGIVSIVRFI